MSARLAVLLSVLAVCLSACALPGLPIGQHKPTPAPDKPASQYFTEALNGYDRAKGIRLTEVVGHTAAFGNVTGGSIDLQGQGFHATLTADNGPIELISSTGSPVFVKASAGHWRQAGHAPEAKVLNGYWTKLVTGSEAGAFKSLLPREFASEYRLRPKNLSEGKVTSVPGTQVKALPLSAPQPGTLYVTQTSPARLVRVEKLATVDWETFTASVAYDDSITFQDPSTDVLDPSDPATLPARYVSSGRAALPQCSSSNATCREGFNLTNQNGPQRAGTKSTLKIHFQGSGNDEIASCLADVPPVGNGQSTTASCEIPTGVLVGYLNAHNTTQYLLKPEVHNAIWDD
ncbi:MAG: hypothetical protein M3Y62_07470 [Candidatus Dormibacteraeota bacterium]|nr:hypothetical protein [Candidatus Dormibacteraeota bacterium]